MYNLINLFNDCPDLQILLHHHLDPLSYIMLHMTCHHCHKFSIIQRITPQVLTKAIQYQNLNLLEWLYDMVGGRFDCHPVIRQNDVNTLRWMSTKLGVALWKVGTLCTFISIISIDVLNIYDENGYDFSRSRLKYLSQIYGRMDILRWLDQRKPHILDYNGEDRSHVKPCRYGARFVDL